VMRTMTRVAVSLTILMFGVGVVFGDVLIVKDGRAAAVILVGDDAGPVAYEAAQELARVIEKATGARLMIYPESELTALYGGYPAGSVSKIYLGDGRRVRELGVDVSKLPPEGFVIKTSGRNLVIAGRDEKHADWGWRAHRQPGYLRGTWHGVCIFLEDYLDVRWLWPGNLGEVVPEAKDVTVKDVDRREEPALVTRALRANHAYGSDWHNAALALGLDLAEQFAMMEELIRWADHQRLGSSLSVASTEFGKEWLEEFGDEHPDWFAMQPSGKRLLTSGGGYRVRMCLSHPGVIDEVVKRIVAYLDAHPDVSGYGLAPSDVHGSYCVCDRCKAWGPTTSDLVAKHAAEVARRVAKERPGKYVHALAYHKYNDAPKGDVRFGENVVLSYVGEWYFGYLCERVHESSVKQWEGWAQRGAKMVWRPNNFCQFNGVPKVYVQKMAEDFRHFYANGLIGVDFDRLVPNFALDGLNYYVAARLTWNPQTPVEEIVDDYCKTGFGPAAPAVKEYFAAIEQITSRIAAERENDRDDDIAARYTKQDLETLRGLLDRAAGLALEDQTSAARVAFLAEGLDFAEVEAVLYHAVEETKTKKPSETRIEELRKLLDRRRTLRTERRASWAVNVVDFVRGEKRLAEQLFATPKPGTFDDLPNAYDVVMELPETWKFKIDPEYVGEKEEWFAAGYDDSSWKEIRVGEFWEKQGYPDYDSAAWYRIKIKLPEDLEGKTVQLCFGAADEIAKVYVNGELAGEHDIGPEGWDKRFFIDVTKQITAGEENVIAVRVIDSDRAGGLWKPIKVVTPKTTLIASRDVWLRRGFPNAYGKDPSMAIGSKDYFRSAIVWQLPEKVKIKRARVVLPLRYHRGTGSYAVYAMREDFYEPKATWKAPFGADPWKDGEGAGAAMKGKPIARAKHGPYEEDLKGTPSALEFDITRLAREWASGRRNYGILIVQDPLDENACAAPHSREARNPGWRPRLEIELLR